MAKTVNLTPQFKQYKPAREQMAKQSISGKQPMGQNTGGVSMFSNAFKRGHGEEVFGSDKNGIWLGAAEFPDAPFRVNMQGQMFFTSGEEGGGGSLVIDAVNNRIVVYDVDGIPRVVIGYVENGF